MHLDLELVRRRAKENPTNAGFYDVRGLLERVDELTDRIDVLTDQVAGRDATIQRVRDKLKQLADRADRHGNVLFDAHGAPSSRVLWDLAKAMRTLVDGDTADGRPSDA